MANLSDLFPADTKRGRLAELLYQRSIAQPEPVPDVRSTPPQIMGGLLGMIDSAKRKVGKNLSELVNNPDQYLRLIAERLPETAQKMASDPGNFIPGGGLVAQTAWHGSPHKFSKFQMDKIGTGEGAQAYGHGMYLAENPAVAKDYAEKLGRAKNASSDLSDAMNKVLFNGEPLMQRFDIDNMPDVVDLARAKNTKGLEDFARDRRASWEQRTADDSYPFKDYASKKLDSYNRLISEIQAGGNVDFPGGHLYKTDIPDEAVARFLDWDKPLSQQPEVVRALMNGDEEWSAYVKQLPPNEQALATDLAIGKKDVYGEGAADYWNALYKANPNIDHNQIHDVRARIFPRTDDQDWLFGVMNGTAAPGAGVRGGGGADLYNSIGGNAEASKRLQELGIPGIRYLDGGSRGAGQGSSNFVIFDPDMIRILERNGEPTGLQPWAPGEYQLRDLLPKQKTKYELAHEVAQRNAALPVEQYLYHGTGEGAFRKILDEGLRPAASGKGYLAPEESYAASYASRKGNPFGNRVLRVKNSEKFTTDPSNGGKDYLFNETIPPSELEVSVNGKWIPLSKYYDESIGIMPR